MARRGKRCLTSARFSMKADILKPAGAPETSITGEVAEWVWQQDEDSGAIVRVFIDDVTTPEYDESTQVAAIIRDVPLSARGIIDGGIRVAGTTERFQDEYLNIDYVKATFPKGVSITKRDRITNIRNSKGELLWKEEEANGHPATIFNVMGVTPVMDPFGNFLEQAVLLERAEVQSA